MIDCWRSNIPKIWEERKIVVPNKPIEELIRVPDNAQYFACIGAVEFGKDEEPNIGTYKGYKGLEHYISFGREAEKKLNTVGNVTGLSKSPEELKDFRERYAVEKFTARQFKPGEVVQGFIGIDGGSTSTKAALVSLDKQVMVKAYQLSKGNPIEDCIDILGSLQKQVEAQGATLEILGVGTTGYAKDILKEVLHADVALVETVAHTQAGSGITPNIYVHKHTGEAGAIGCGIEAARLYHNVPMEEGIQRLIIATCEKGTVEDIADMKGIKSGLDTIKKANPNIVDEAASKVWTTFKPPIVKDTVDDLISSIKPFDKLEEEHIKHSISWINSGEEIFRIQKPDIPPKHLVSYFVLIDENTKKILLMDHINAGLWLPSGGHVELNENPKATVEREIMEELNLTADFISDIPFFITQTETVTLKHKLPMIKMNLTGSNGLVMPKF
ncbi:unnamed protein product [Rotaria sp. Silwood1]|nr:unnamed protein product [Rotaria sp. Silwood1]CAF4836469.1 unnamed protein product [Rotaria sp. Silwood1]